MNKSKLPGILMFLFITAGLTAASVAYADAPKIMKNEHDFKVMALLPSYIFLTWATLLAINFMLLRWFPNRTERLTTLFEHSPWKSFFIGLANILVLGFLFAVTEKHVKPLSVLIALVFMILLFIGIHARSRCLGRTILRASGHEPGAFVELIVGFSTVGFLCVIPVLGWFVLSTYFCAGGLGAITLSIFGKQPKSSGGVDLDSHEI